MPQDQGMCSGGPHQSSQACGGSLTPRVDGKPHIGDENGRILPDEDVLRLDVPVSNAVRVQIEHGIADWSDDALRSGCFGDSAPVLKGRVQITVGDVLEQHEEVAAGFPRRENWQDVGMGHCAGKHRKPSPLEAANWSYV